MRSSAARRTSGHGCANTAASAAGADAGATRTTTSSAQSACAGARAGSRRQSYEPHYEGSSIVDGPSGGVCSIHGNYSFEAQAGHH